MLLDTAELTGLQCRRCLVWIFSSLLTVEVPAAGHAAECFSQSAVLGGERTGARDQTLLFLFLHLGQLNNINEIQEEMGQCPYQLRTSCLFQSAQVVCHIRLETAHSQHAQGEELSAWNRSKSEVLPTSIVSQDTAQLLQKSLGLSLGPTPRSYYS